MKKLSPIFLCLVIFSVGYMRATEDLNTLFRRAHDFYKDEKYEQAIEYYKRCLDFAPNNKQLLYTIGVIYNEMGEFDQAQKIFEPLYEQDPSYGLLRGHLWKIYLRNKDWVKGAHFVLTGSRHWWYDEDISGKTVLLQYPAVIGLGDIFNFVRYAKRLHDAGAEVILQGRGELKTLLALCPYIKEVIDGREEPPKVDKVYDHEPRLHLLMDDRLPLDVPYIYADQNLEAHWKEKLSADKNFKIGLCWSSFGDRAGITRRSINVAELEPLKNIPGVSFYSLQKINGVNQLENKSDDFVIREFSGDFDQSHGRFMDTAAVMKNLDLVISVDTSIAHLAGALGVQSWTLLPRRSCWRWLRDRTDCPWYPTMRLFRQKKLGDWDEVVEQVVAALKDLIGKKIKL